MTSRIGKIGTSTKDTNENRANTELDLLQEIVELLKINNAHMEIITNEIITNEDIEE